MAEKVLKLHTEIIKDLLSKPSPPNIFDKYVEELELYFNRKVYNLQELKDRENKKLKGDQWEYFCKDWLIATGRYQNVWLLKECPHFPELTNQDNGIDLICQTKTGFHSVQCKYRSGRGKVNWASLSTFIALSERTGKFDKFIVMTNCASITRKLPKSPKDMSICKGSFRGTKREQWIKMIGSYQENILSEEVRTVERTSPKKSVHLNAEELRKARLAYFEKKTSEEVKSICLTSSRR